MNSPDQPDAATVNHAMELLANTLVRFAWDGGVILKVFDVEHKGAAWQAGVRVVALVDTPFERDFTERLPE